MIYFIKNTKYCHKLKLFKLLYFLDFEHFRQTGRPVTGLEYFARKMGPVPKKLNDIIEDSTSEDLGEYIYISRMSIKDSFDNKQDAFKFTAKKQFDKKVFSPRELEIMKNFAVIFKETVAKDMTEASHEINTPWHKTY